MHLKPHDYRIYYVNIDLRHQYGISVAESQTFLLAKRPSVAMSEQKRLPFAGYHINVSMVSFLHSLLLMFHFCVLLSQLSELVWKLVEEISLQWASERSPSFGPPANGNKSNTKKSRLRPNRNLTGTIYH